MGKIIAQAAESIIIKDGNKIIKRRIKKGYRIPEIDEKLRKLRKRSERKIIEKLQNKINVPEIIKVDEKNKEIDMSFIKGKKLSEDLDKLSLKEQEKVCRNIGQEIGKMHDENIIHGDLTTSNMILVENKAPNKQKDCCPDDSKLSVNSHFLIFLIDFGLSFHSIKVEDKAVDIHLFRQALESKHFQHWEKLYSSFLEGYNPKDKSSILKQLEEVESRGRYHKKAE